MSDDGTRSLGQGQEGYRDAGPGRDVTEGDPSGGFGSGGGTQDPGFGDALDAKLGGIGGLGDAGQAKEFGSGPEGVTPVPGELLADQKLSVDPAAAGLKGGFEDPDDEGPSTLLSFDTDAAGSDTLYREGVVETADISDLHGTVDPDADPNIDF